MADGGLEAVSAVWQTHCQDTPALPFLAKPIALCCMK
jgi:hypothetical protein